MAKASKAGRAYRIIAASGELLLVEWYERRERHRALVPAGVPMIAEEFRRGIPAGVNAQTLALVLESDIPSISERLERELHRRGLFAAADAAALPEPGRLVEAALAEAIRPTVALVLDAVRQEV